jgi:homoserine kinase type II
MAVFTPVSEAQARELLTHFDLGEFRAIRGIESGIENSNFFLTTLKNHRETDYVLTLFERLSAEQLPFYLNFTSHLAMHGLPVPGPKVDRQGHALFTLNGKPGAIVSKLHGKPVVAPSPAQCAQLGATVASMHLAAQDYEGTQPNLRGLPWWQAVVPQIRPHLSDDLRELIDEELAFHTALAQTTEYQALPRSAVHADLFRDNTMFEGDTLSGIFDFYFAGVDTWLFDLCVCLNDWCIVRDGSAQHGALLPDHVQALLAAYTAVREPTPDEIALTDALLRQAAFRFWVSRLWDYHLPRDASLLKVHDPAHFEKILRMRRTRPFSELL